MHETTGRPRMSVVLATPDTYETIRMTVLHLRRQTARHELELIVVAPSRERLGMDASEIEGFARADVVELGAIRSIGSANAAGIRRATAPIVALAEDHCFPDPDWAARLIEAHQGPWAAVGPAVRNANPRTAISWADLFIGYGPWLLSTGARQVDLLPGHNSSYKRDELLSYGPQLEPMLEAETVLHWDLCARGRRLYFDPAACVSHTNFSRWSSWIPVQFLCGRVFAGARARGMSRPKRVVYAAGSPLIPLVRLARCARPARAAGLTGRFVRSLPALIVGLALDAAGQMAGYALGPGDAHARLTRFEFRRVKHITGRDRLDIEMRSEARA